MTAALSEYLIRPELLTSVVVSACTFDLDFAAGTLLADAVFQVSTVTSASAAGQSSSSSSGSKNGPQNKGQRAGSRSSGSCERLELGSLKGRVSICLPARDIDFSFARPNLKVMWKDFARDEKCMCVKRESERRRGQLKSQGNCSLSPPPLSFSSPNISKKSLK
jgi:hypothetical protein